MSKYSVIGASFNNNTCPYKNFSCRILVAKCSHHAEASMARLSVKSLTFIISGFLLLLYFYHINFSGSSHEEIRETKTSHEQDRSSLSDITCVLNREVAKNIGAKQAGVRKIPCKSDATEVWLPFSFIKNQYEARGERVTNKASKTQEFELSHSYSKVYTPTEK